MITKISARLTPQQAARLAGFKLFTERDSIDVELNGAVVARTMSGRTLRIEPAEVEGGGQWFHADLSETGSIRLSRVICKALSVLQVSAVTIEVAPDMSGAMRAWKHGTPIDNVYYGVGVEVLERLLVRVIQVLRELRAVKASAEKDLGTDMASAVFPRLYTFMSSYRK